MGGNEEFDERLERVRRRFTAALDGRITAAWSAAEKLSAAGDEAADIVITAHRLLHDMCGIAPTLGFAAIGKTARAAQDVLRAAAKERRALTASELAAFTNALEKLRAAALASRVMETNRG
jgi:HPt (histidine-containing phosphotransfer) domain-containing protein